MSNLILTPNISDPDGFYEELLKMHEGLDEEVSHQLNAGLLMVLANHIGNRDILRDAMTAAAKACSSKET